MFLLQSVLVFEIYLPAKFDHKANLILMSECIGREVWKEEKNSKSRKGGSAAALSQLHDVYVSDHGH